MSDMQFIRNALPTRRAGSGAVSILRHLIVGIAGLTLLLGGCDSAAPFDIDACSETIQGACWTFLGLDDVEVTALADTPWGIIAGSNAHGVHRFNAGNGRWTPTGLSHAQVTSLAVTSAEGPRLLAGMAIPDGEQADASIYATEDGGRTWVESDGGLARAANTYSSAFSLATDPTEPSRVFAGLWGSIIGSTDGGDSWEIATGEGAWAQGISGLTVAPADDGTVMSSLYSPSWTSWILRSGDGGETWDMLPSLFIRSIVADAPYPHTYWAVGTAGVLRSSDRGETWVPVNTGGTATALLAAGDDLVVVGHRALDPASSNEKRVLRMGRSSDGGLTWAALAVPDDAAEAVSIIRTAGGAILIGTRSGVWRVVL